MQYNDVVNMVYSYDSINSVDIMLNSGELVTVPFVDLELPYFYASENLYVSPRVKDDDRGKIKRCEYVIKDTLRDDDVTKLGFYHIEVTEPNVINHLKGKALYTAESNIQYLERRLGADGVITFAPVIHNYAYIDIEEQKGHITLIGAEDERDGFAEYHPFHSVKEFLSYLVEHKITAINAWNGEGYDFGRMEREIIADKSITDEELKRWYAVLKVDGMLFYSTYLQRRKMSLNNAAKEQGVKLKIELSGNFDTVSMKELEEYNKNDVDMLRDIVEKTGVMQVAMGIAYLTGILPTKISATRMADNLFIKRLQPKGIILFDYTNRHTKEFEGATILTPDPGRHENVASLDLDHLYPSVMTYYDYKGSGAIIYEYIRSFTRVFLESRAEFKQKYAETGESQYDVLQKAYKILANSLYGVFGNKYYRYANSDIAAFVTENGRKVRAEMQKVVETFGYNVIYSDTDSLFVENISRDKVDILADVVNRNIAPFHVKVEKYFLRMISLLSSSGEGVKKRYAGITEDGEIMVTGAEYVRGDSCELTKDVEYSLFERLLRDEADEESIMGWLESIKASFKNDLSKLEFDKVIDVEKPYKTKTRALKVFEQLGGKFSVSEEEYVQKDGAKRSRKIYRLTSPDGSKLLGVRWVMGEKGEPIALGETDTVESVKERIDYDWYWNKAIAVPINRVLGSVGFRKMELVKKSRASKSKKITINNER